MAMARRSGNQPGTLAPEAPSPAGARDEPVLPKPPFDLEEPGTILFTAHRALRGQALNRFALSLRFEVNRGRFLSDPHTYAAGFGLGEDELEMLKRCDWTGLLLAGGHIQALLKVAAAVGKDLWDIGADNVGGDRAALIAACPRVVGAVPGEA